MRDSAIELDLLNALINEHPTNAHMGSCCAYCLADLDDDHTFENVSTHDSKCPWALAKKYLDSLQ